MVLHGRNNRIAAVLVSVAVLSAVVAAAIRTDGFRETRVNLNDGGVWVTRTGQAGRLNTQIRSIEIAVSGSTGLDIAQAGDSVVMFDTDKGEMQSINAALAEKSDMRKIPRNSSVALGGSTGLVADPSKGRIWATPTTDLGQLDIKATKPDLVLKGKNTESVVAATTTGGGFVYQKGSKVLSELVPGQKPTSRELDQAVAEPSITAVGDQPVLLNGKTSILVVPGHDDIDLGDLGDNLALQQPGPEADSVLVGSDDALVSVPLDGGTPTVLAEGGAGGSVAPVWVEGCAYGAWADSVRWARWCEGDDAPASAKKFDDPQVKNGARLVFRVNRNRVVLNDRVSGVNLMVDLPEPEIVKDWDQALDKNQKKQDDQKQTKQKQQAKCSKQPKPPKTKPDEAGTRPDRPVIVPVLENDESDRCDVLSIAPFAKGELPGKDVADVAIVENGSALQVTPASGRTEPIELTYRAVGKGGETAEKVRVTVSTDAENGAPEPVKDLTVVESGQTVRHNVLVNDRDPDGDALSLAAVLPDKSDGSTPQFQANGMVTYTAPGGFVGSVTLPYTVEDERGETADSQLTIRVQASGANLAPKARNDRLDAFVGKETKVNVLTNDTDPNGDKLTVSEVESDSGLSLEELGIKWDPDGTLRANPTEEGEAWVRYQIADKETTAEAWVFIRSTATSKNTPPVAVRDDVVARPGVPALADLSANDLDADGDLLAVTSVTVPPDAGLSVELLDMRVARVTASAAFQKAAIASYTVTDGTATASGKLVIRPYRVSGLDQPPITLDDQASVRVGNATAIPVLRNDVDPEGEQLKIVEVGEVDPSQGRLFIQDDELRFKAASSAKRSVTTTYTVQDPGGNRASGEVRIDIIAKDQPNQPPKSPRVEARVFAGESVKVRVPLVGLDPDGDTVSVVGVDPSGAPKKGTVQLIGDGFEYQADKGASGADGFTFTVRDDRGLSSTGRARIVIAATPKVNTPPSAVPDRVHMTPGTSRTIAVLANDIDADGDALSLLTGEKDGPTQPPKGMGSVRLDGNRLVYEAPGSIKGDTQEASFTYGVTDGRGGSARGVVTVKLDNGKVPNEPPIAVDDFVTTQLVNKTVSVDVLANDRDPDDPEARLKVKVIDASNATVKGDGSISVKLGTKSVSFVYEITDAGGDTAQALVSIPVAKTLPPVAVLDEVEMEAKTTKVIDVTKNDENPGGKVSDLKVVKVINARGGQTKLSGNKVEFSSASDWRGDAGFSYIVRNKAGDEAVGSARITLTGQDFPPEFTATAVELPAGGNREIDLQALTVDPDTEKHEFSGLSGSTGKISADIKGSVLTISASEDAKGSKTTLTLKVADNKNEIKASIPVTVSENDAPLPVAVDDAAETIQGKEVSIPATSNDVDPIGKGLTVLRVEVSGGGGVGRADPSGGSVTFTPSDSFFGSALLTYTLQDSSKDADREVRGTIRVTVYGRPSAPPAPSGTSESHLVRLSWGVPANNGAPITGYAVESDVGGVKTTSTTNSAVIDGLKNAQAYRFRVAAMNKAAPDVGSIREDQWSAWSPALTPDQFPDQPAAPTVVFKKEDNNGGAGGVLHVSWTAPNVDGSPIQGYRVQSSPSSGAPRTVPAGTTSIAWSGLTNGTPYTFSVIAYNKVDDSDASPSSAPQTPAGVPGAPQAVKSQRVTDGRNDNGGLATVSWGASDANGDPQNTRYRVTTSPGTTSKETDQTTADWSGLNPSTAYTFTVVAFNKAGDGTPASAEPVYAEGKPASPSAPKFLPSNGGVQTSGVSSPDTRGPGRVTFEYSTSSASDGFNAFDGSSFPLTNGTSASVWIRSCKHDVNSSGVEVGCSTGTKATNSATGSGTVTPFGPPPLGASASDRTVRWTWGATAAGVERYDTVGQSGLSDCGGNCREKTFGYSEHQCLQVNAVGQGVTQPSGSICGDTVAPPQPIIDFYSSGKQIASQNCSGSPCYYATVSVTNMPAGTYSITCRTTSGEAFSWNGTTLTTTVAKPAGSWTQQLNCGAELGYSMYVQVGNYSSPVKQLR